MSNLLIYSNSPWAPSGYGTQTAQVTKGFTALGHKVAIAAFHGLQGAPLAWEGGVTVYPGSTEDPWAQDVLPGYYGHHKADLLITLMDAWVLNPAGLTGMNVAHWLPVDAAASAAGISPHLGSMDRRVLEEGGGRPVAMSRFGHQVLTDAGFFPLYAPHGIPVDVWKPPEDREALRAKLGLEGKFVIGINAANQDPVRKGFPEQFAAFAQFQAKHPEAILGVHSRIQTRQGVDLTRLAADLGIRDSVIFADQFAVASGMMGAPDLAKWYGVLDVLSNCSYGEGFGLPVIESQACGTPVITTAFSAMIELTGAGWCVAGEPYWNRGHNGWWMRPSAHAICAAYEDAFEQAATMREDARKFALQYDADKVLREHWIPVLRDLLGEPADEAPAAIPAGASA